ncbi:MAG: hypothetical protein HC887_04790 [Desulfobacteraceae bacterium]|nr:hypothetical protein [Desulfobacteraceae bacterium]
MMNKARGPVWHQKQKKQGIIPKGLKGIDREATWSKSQADGWVYGYGSFSFTSHEIPVLGCFILIKNSRNESKTMWFETGHYKGLIDYVVMDSKADDYALFRELKRQSKITLITRCGRNMIKSPERNYMFQVTEQPEHKELYQQRCHTVEPMQGLVKDIFELEHCWMRGEQNNRWLFAAMGLVIQMCQLRAYRENRSTLKIKDEVLG